MSELKQTLLVGTDQRQQADSSDTIHSVWEVIEYASSLVTLQPGDIIGAGTSGGVGKGTSVRGSQLWLVAGDEITATIDKIGTLKHKVEAATAPRPGTGAGGDLSKAATAGPALRLGIPAQTGSTGPVARPRNSGLASFVPALRFALV